MNARAIRRQAAAMRMRGRGLAGDLQHAWALLGKNGLLTPNEVDSIRTRIERFARQTAADIDRWEAHQLGTDRAPALEEIRP